MNTNLGILSQTRKQAEKIIDFLHQNRKNTLDRRSWHAKRDRKPPREGEWGDKEEKF